MTPALSRVLTVRSEDEMSRLAAGLAPALTPGDAILLKGGLGSGKTHFARAAIQARLREVGLFEDIPSPTYTLVQTYSDGKAEIWHCDLYRIGDIAEMSELGLDDAFETAICLVEWPERLGDLAPKDALTIAISLGERLHERVLSVSSSDPRWGAVLDAAFEGMGSE